MSEDNEGIAGWLDDMVSAERKTTKPVVAPPVEIPLDPMVLQSRWCAHCCGPLDVDDSDLCATCQSKALATKEPARHVNRFQKRSGFTLIEIMIVVILMGILAMLAAPMLMQSKRKAYDATVVSDLRRAEEHLITFYMESITSAYPATPAEADFVPSTGVTVTQWSIEIVGREQTVHIHMEHANSDSYYHATYFAELDYEKRPK